MEVEIKVIKKLFADELLEKEVLVVEGYNDDDIDVRVVDRVVVDRVVVDRVVVDWVVVDWCFDEIFLEKTKVNFF